jgi:hypothetical protein
LSLHEAPRICDRFMIQWEDMGSAKKVKSRLERHRSEMRRRGFKLVQLWVPDPDAPGFRGAVRRTREFLAAHPDAEWDEFAREALDRAPGWVP